MKFQVKECQLHRAGQLLWLTSLLYKEHILSLNMLLVLRVLLVWELFFLLNLLCAHYLMVLQINSQSGHFLSQKFLDTVMKGEDLLSQKVYYARAENNQVYFLLLCAFSCETLSASTGSVSIFWGRDSNINMASILVCRVLFRRDCGYWIEEKAETQIIWGLV